MKKYFLAVFAVIASLSVSAQPLISSFFPSKGNAGTIVTITGANFSATPAGNLVRFGVAKADVIFASTTSLTVMVPGAATFEPVTVTVNGLIASSNLPFNLTFPGGGVPFNSSSFDKYERFSSGGTFALADMNDDGKTDIARNTNDYLSLHRNNSIASMPLFQQTNDTTKKARYNSPVASGDMDGDGKTDLVVVRKDSTAFTVFRNIGTTSRPDYDAGTSFRTPPYAYSVATGDIDGDGRYDIVIGSYDFSGPDTLVVHRNTSANGVISFTEAIKIPGAFTCVRISDLNGDGKQDIVAIPYDGFYFTVLQNTGSAGSISFTSSSFYMNASGNLNGVICDLDNDGKPDVAIGQYSTSGVRVIKNTSTASTISFWQGGGGGIQLLSSGNRPQFVTAADMDGDGRPDLVTANYSASTISVIRNTNSVAGSFSFATNVDYPLAFGSDPADIAAADLDGDSKPEIVLQTTYSNFYLNIFRNAVGEPAAVILCPPGANTSITADVAGSVYQWQMNDSNGYVNITAGMSNFSGSTGSVLTMSNVPSSWYGYRFRCVVDGVAGREHVLKFKTSYVGPVNGNWSSPANWSCNVLPDAYTDVTIGYGNITVDINAQARTIRTNEGARITIGAGKYLSVSK